MLAALRFTPPFGAAAAMTHIGATAFSGLGLIVLWSIGLTLILIRLERRPAPAAVQSPVRGAASRDVDFLDRVGGLFPPDTAPLVSHWLRFFVRNKRFRMLSLISLPMAGFLTYNIGQLPRNHGNLFVPALGTLPIVTFLGTSRIAVNLYGYTGGAFRRFVLFPADPAASLRAGSYASVLVGGFMLALAAIVWIIFAPRPLELSVILLPVMNGVTALFLFNAAGLWTTLFGARPGKYDKSLGNDMSLLGNILVIGSVIICMLVPQLLHRFAPGLVSNDNISSESWGMLALAPLAIVLYWGSLRAAGSVFASRRERLLAVLEGKA